MIIHKTLILSKFTCFSVYKYKKNILPDIVALIHETIYFSLHVFVRLSFELCRKMLNGYERRMKLCELFFKTEVQVVGGGEHQVLSGRDYIQ